MRRKRVFLTLAAVVLVVLAGCASIGSEGDVAGGGDGGEASFATGGSAAEEMDADGGDGGSGGGSAATGGDAAMTADQTGGDGGGADGGQAALPGQSIQVDRAIIRTGTIRLRVEDFDQARGRIANRARSHGGYVSQSGSTHHTRDNKSWTTGYVVVRIPSDEFSNVLSDTRTRGTVLDEETQTRDVTDQLVDIEARLQNLRERRDRLRTFYEQANSTGELLRIEEQLSSVQSEIEQLEARQRSLEQRVALATLRVELEEPDPERTPDREPSFVASLAGAFRGSMATLANIATGAVLVAARLAPFLLFLGVPAVAIGLLARRRLGVPLLPRRDGTEESTEPPGQHDEPVEGGDPPGSE